MGPWAHTEKLKHYLLPDVIRSTRKNTQTQQKPLRGHCHGFCAFLIVFACDTLITHARHHVGDYIIGRVGVQMEL